ncbi:hypothetical protein B9Q03_06890 [Candidatus Marsarchaeota G2 archaeon OSP_D]|uniref:Cytochrome n=5 Tax=Candidatus Marsarchaeota group 2 TaxID=2203771 RepID=A0A2R6B721_9ARCH|nr:MAG: hypothetical protein B9Q03_06890 [Candidatus Marsarchaeota G2 archaeon OSP_D]PSN92806.1 MAG: hypothetical protein B9Q08_00665 [Candidatus Marsarchaeota G2 archaeon ECH_B_SAG-M15]PSN94393.1 MAG: hypothetical protein B9Q06_09210 [Candidatus Marsarchaeota G2 archaeon ECH_B_2]
MLAGESLFSWYRNMRETSPVYFDKDWNCWNIYTYDYALQALRNPTVFSSTPPIQGSADSLSGSMILMDPPKHTVFRSLVNRFFTAKAVQVLEPQIERLAENLLNSVECEDAFDFVEAFAVPLPVTVIARLLGVPEEDMPLFKKWTDSIVGVDGGGGYTSSQEGLNEYFKEIIESRRAEPKSDLISELLSSEVDGRSLSTSELLGFCTLLLVAGNETTTNLLSNAVKAFSENPEAQEKLLANPEATLQLGIEEVLRYYSPVQVLPHRFAKMDTTIGGQTIRSGEQVAIWLGSANRDERKFVNAEKFVVDRRPNEHIAFGSGSHMCLGAPLARLEAKVGLSVFFRRFKGLSVKEFEMLSGPLIYGYRRLIVEVEQR